MKKFAKIVDKETGMCVVGLGNDSKYYLSIGLELLDVVEAPDGAWYLLEKTQGDEYKERMKIYRKSIFEKEFFKTSQGFKNPCSGERIWLCVQPFSALRGHIQ